MKKKRFVIIATLIISVCIIIIFSTIYKDAKRKQQEKMEAIHRQELKLNYSQVSGHKKV